MKYRIAVLLALLLLAIPQVAFAQDDSTVYPSAAGAAATNLSEAASSPGESTEATAVAAETNSAKPSVSSDEASSTASTISTDEWGSIQPVKPSAETDAAGKTAPLNENAAAEDPALSQSLPDAEAEDGTAETPVDESADNPETTPSISYRAKLNDTWQDPKSDGESAGSTSKEKSLKAVVISIDSAVEGAVQYQVHGNGTGWLAVVSNGQETGVTGDDFIDAMRVALTGDLANVYDIAYRAYVKGAGWQDWVSNAAIAGTVSDSKQLKKFQIKLVEKTSTPPEEEASGIVDVRYQVYVKGKGWTSTCADNEIAGTTGQALRGKNFKISLDTGTFDGTVKYRVHLTDGSWTSWKKNGQAVGSSNLIDAIKIKITGSIADVYDIVYRTHVQDIGWQRRLRNGEIGGIVDSGLRIEALQIVLEPKATRSGWIGSGDTWSFYEDGTALANKWLVTEESPIDLSVVDKQRYWIDANGTLAVNRFVNPETKSDEKAGYAAFATDSGAIFTGKRETDKGIMFATSKGKLYTKTRWLTTSQFDGSKQRYRLKKNGVCAYVRTGLFKVDGKKYYGWEDGRGYVMRSTTWFVADKWYKADSKGALTNVDNKTTQHINRYVKWAIKIAEDDSHGYSQYTRWGPDYDCSSLVCAALLAAGFPNSGATYTGNMYDCLTSIGFVWHEGTSGLRRGDIMLVHADYRQHTEIYIGSDMLVGAHIAETGDIYGQEGDQTGNEISVTSYYNAPWQGYLRYRG